MKIQWISLQNIGEYTCSGSCASAEPARLTKLRDLFGAGAGGRHAGDSLLFPIGWPMKPSMCICFRNEDIIDIIGFVWKQGVPENRLVSKNLFLITQITHCLIYNCHDKGRHKVLHSWFGTRGFPPNGHNIEISGIHFSESRGMFYCNGNQEYHATFDYRRVSTILRLNMRIPELNVI